MHSLPRRSLAQLLVWSLNVALPLVVGSLIYITLRVDPPQVLSPFSLSVSLTQSGSLSTFVGSLPSFLWTYALVAALRLVWREDGANLCRTFTWIAVAVGIAYEVGQATGLLQGTFDVLDLLFTIIGAALAAITVSEVNVHDAETRSKNRGNSLPTGHLCHAGPRQRR